MDRIKKQSDFSRLKANDAKMGAYYTDVGHCASSAGSCSFRKTGRCAAWNRPSGTGRPSLR